MKLVKTEILINAGSFPDSAEWNTIRDHIYQAIRSVSWPPGSGKFTVHDQSGKKRGEGSGVRPIRDMFCENLKRFGWQLETPVDISTRISPGPIDATYPVKGKLFAVEWETGNISSSHRAVNKMALGILSNKLIGGALILPTRNMYQYLTDRVGNFEELEPYFDLWKSLKCDEGLLAIIAVEHDDVSKSVPRIPKGTNGRALK